MSKLKIRMLLLQPQCDGMKKEGVFEDNYVTQVESLQEHPILYLGIRLFLEPEYSCILISDFQTPEITAMHFCILRLPGR